MNVKDHKLLNPNLLVFILSLGIVLIVPNGWNLREQRLMTFEILTLVILAVVIFQVNKPLGMLLGWATLTLPFHAAIDPGVMYALTCYAVLYLLVVSKNWNKEWLWNTICCVAILNVIWQVLQLNGIWIGQTPAGKMYLGLLSNPNETSAFLAVCLPAFFRKEWRLGILIILIGLYLGKSIGGIVAAGIAGVIYLILNGKQIGWKYVTLLLVAIICLLGIYMEHKRPSLQSNLDRRGRYWMDMIPICTMKPLGWGLGQFKFVMPMIEQPLLIGKEGRLMLYQNISDKDGYEQALKIVSGGDPDYFRLRRFNEIWLEAHNEYMEFWFACGIVGLLYLLIVIYDTLTRAKNGIAKYGFMISCLSAIWFFPWQITPCAILAVLYLGILHGGLHEKEI